MEAEKLFGNQNMENHPESTAKQQCSRMGFTMFNFLFPSVVSVDALPNPTSALAKDICRGFDVAVSRPFLHILERKAQAKQIAGGTVPQLMETNLRHPVRVENALKFPCNGIRRERPANPWPNEIVIPRGDGTHEAAVLPNAETNLEAIREALIAAWSDEYDYEELAAEIAIPEGLTAYFTDFNAKGDNRDAMYLMTPEFTLNSDEDFIVVYGVNHAKTGKALYANFPVPRLRRGMIRCAQTRKGFFPEQKNLVKHRRTAVLHEVSCFTPSLPVR